MSAIDKATANASPRPWRVDAFEGMDLLCSADGHTVAGMHAHNDKPNSALIVQAVNEYAALKATEAQWHKAEREIEKLRSEVDALCAVAEAAKQISKVDKEAHDAESYGEFELAEKHLELNRCFMALDAALSTLRAKESA